MLVRKPQALVALDRTYRVGISVITGMQGAGGESRLEATALAHQLFATAPLIVEASPAATNAYTSSA